MKLLRAITLRAITALITLFAIQTTSTAVEIVPGSQHKYVVTRELSSTLKSLGTTTKTNEVYRREITASVGEPDDEGLLPVTLKVTRVSGEAPAINFNTLQVTPTKFDTNSWDGRTAPPAHSFLPYIAQIRKPLTLHYDADGKLNSVTGSADVAREVGGMLDRMFASDPSFKTTKAYYRLGYRDSVRQWEWKDRIIFGLPEDFDFGSEWEQKDVRVFHMYYVYVNGQFVAVDESENGYELEATYDIPKSGKGTVKYGIQEYIYAAKNGTGEGKIIVRPDGWIHQSETTAHAYFDATLKSGPQTVTVAGMTISVGASEQTFDEYYVRVKHTVERLEE